MTRFYKVPSLVLSIACFATVLSGCGETKSVPNQRTMEQQQAVKIIVHEVVLGADTQEIEAVGTARARQAATIFAQASGEVQSMYFKAGEWIKKGQKLAQLDDADQRLAVQRARVTLKDAEQLLNRYERIDVPEAVSDSQKDGARTAVEAAQIELALAQEALADRTVIAPFSGFAGLTDVDPGARITTNTELLRLDDRSVLYVDFSIPEQAFGRVGAGDKIKMTPFSSNGVAVEGLVQAVDSRIDPTERSFVIRAIVDNQDDRLRPGMSFRINISLPGNSYPKVPEAAIVWGGDGAYLWAVKEGAAHRMPVTIVNRGDGFVLVKAPLKEGDLIVAEGVQKMRPGLKIEVLSRETDGEDILVAADAGSHEETLK